MNLVQGENDIVINVGPNYFKVYINGKKFKESTAVDAVRLSKYSHLSFHEEGTCVKVYKEKSYVRYPPGMSSY
jgi:hypothetical protein